jgi:hypothetical protein
MNRVASFATSHGPAAEICGEISAVNAVAQPTRSKVRGATSVRNRRHVANAASAVVIATTIAWAAAAPAPPWLLTRTRQRTAAGAISATRNQTGQHGLYHAQSAVDIERGDEETTGVASSAGRREQPKAEVDMDLQRHGIEAER